MVFSFEWIPAGNPSPPGNGCPEGHLVMWVGLAGLSRCLENVAVLQR